MTGIYVGETTKQKIGDQYLGGAGIVEVGATMGMTVDAVAEVLADLGISQRTETLTRERARLDAEAAELYNAGMSIRAIVRAQHRPYGTVHRALDAGGVHLRPRGAPRGPRPPVDAVDDKGAHDAP